MAWQTTAHALAVVWTLLQCPRAANQCTRPAASPLPPCLINGKSPRFDGNNTECYFDRGGEGIFQGQSTIWFQKLREQHTLLYTTAWFGYSAVSRPIPAVCAGLKSHFSLMLSRLQSGHKFCILLCLICLASALVRVFFLALMDGPSSLICLSFAPAQLYSKRPDCISHRGAQ